MTDIILVFVPFLAAVAFFIRARGELKGRLAAERQIAELERAVARRDVFQREWLGTLAHELRTPAGGVLGYGELLADEAFGSLDERGNDAIRRLRACAEQLLVIVDGIDRFAASAPVPDDEPAPISAADAIRDAADSLAVDAAARGANIHVDEGDVRLVTRPGDLRRVLALALSAAIKASPGSNLGIAAEPGAIPAIFILHTRLDPVHDDPDRVAETTADHADPSLSGPALRIGMARVITETALAGRLQLTATPDGCTVRIELPLQSAARHGVSSAVDEAED